MTSREEGAGVLRLFESAHVDGPTILPLTGSSSGRRSPRMHEYLEVALATGVELRPLDGERVTIGRHAGNDIVLASDDSVSRLHAVLERLGPGWWLRDLASRNGTFVNGARVAEGRALQHGDELRIGSTRLVYRISRPSADDQAVTLAREPAPPLTPREREVLVALCRPVFSGDVLGVPASTRSIAAELVVTEDAVKQHLLRLYDKFALQPSTSGNRRVELAREAVLRGAVSRADIETGGGRSASR
jgi:DNA-binding CsgD family transcriptional regulator